MSKTKKFLDSSVLLYLLSGDEEKAEIAERSGCSIYDATIVAAAIEGNCTDLLTEDLQLGQIINDKLAVSNPFK